MAYLSTLSTAASRLSQRMSEEIGELGLIDSFTASATGKYWESGGASEQGLRETKKLLEGKLDKEKLEGVKRVLALMSLRGPSISLPFFPFILRCLSPSSTPSALSSSGPPSTTSRTLHRLISIYILRHARLSPDLALLCVNSYQKDLGDSDPSRRATAVRVLAEMVGDESGEDGIGPEGTGGVEGLEGLVGVVLERAARDTNWYVRREAAMGICTVYKNAPSLLPSLRSILPTLLSSPSSLSLPSALHAYEILYPQPYQPRPDLIHPHFRRFCRLLIDADEWGQGVMLRVLTVYARREFQDPDDVQAPDSDLEILLKHVEALFQSANPSVVLSAIKSFYHLAPSARLPAISRPLIRLVAAPPEIQLLVLNDTAIIAEEHPELLTRYAPEYLIRPTDSDRIKALKLRILISLTTSNNVRGVLRELQEYVKDPDLGFAAEAIKAIGTCAMKIPNMGEEGLKILIRLSADKNEIIVSQSVVVIRSLLARIPSTTAESNGDPSTGRPSLISRLARLLVTNKIRVPAARSNVFWLVGQYAQDEGLLDCVAIDVARLGTKTFTQEADVTKLQILTMSAKVLVLCSLSSLGTNQRPMTLLFQHLTTLARYDASYEVRDRARFLKTLLAAAGIGVKDKSVLVMDMDAFSRGESQQIDEATKRVEAITLGGQQVRTALFDGKGGEGIKMSLGKHRDAHIGSFHLLTGRNLETLAPLPPWRTTPADPSLRAEAVESPPSPMSRPQTSSSRTQGMTGFGSESLAKASRGKAVPVVLTPAASKAPTAARGPQNLNNFLDDDEEEDEEDEEDEGDEDEEGEEEEEESEEEEEEDEDQDEAEDEQAK